MCRKYRGRLFHLKKEEGVWLAQSGQWYGAGRTPFLAIVTARPLTNIVKRIVYENRRLLEELENR